MKPVFLHKKTRGFSLIEVLVAMVILAVGLLGVAGLFANSLKSADNAYLHSQAVVLAYDMSDRIRANPSALAKYGQTPPTTITNNCRNSTCTPAALASADLYEWNNSVSSSLPSGTASVAVNGTTATVTVGWTSHAKLHSFSVVVQL
jgi:type IV pilus assembly protein PilV